MPVLLGPAARRWAWCSFTLGLWSAVGGIYVNDNCAEITPIIGESMSPTLSPRYAATGAVDRVLWQKIGPLGVPPSRLRRGDVVLFHSPHHPERDVVKRIIATEGDVVRPDPRRRPERLRDGADLPASRAWDVVAARGGERVPEGHVWVEGDNWRKTRDSNTYGPVSKSLILGKATAVVWPLERFGTRPWEGYRSRTEVVPGSVVKRDEMEVVDAIRYG